MPKTCRTCKVLVPWWRCPKQHAFMSTNEVMECYEPRETPLLVDEFAIASKLLLERMDNIGNGMLSNLDLLAAREILRRVLVQHQEEVGDV